MFSSKCAAQVQTLKDDFRAYTIDPATRYKHYRKVRRPSSLQLVGADGIPTVANGIPTVAHGISSRLTRPRASSVGVHSEATVREEGVSQHRHDVYTGENGHGAIVRETVDLGATRDVREEDNAAKTLVRETADIGSSVLYMGIHCVCMCVCVPVSVYIVYYGGTVCMYVSLLTCTGLRVCACCIVLGELCVRIYVFVYVSLYAYAHCG